MKCLILLVGQLELLSNKVFDGLNSAYRKRYSCETALVRLVEDWKRSLTTTTQLTEKTGCDQATPVENGKQSNADAPRGHYLAHCCGIFVKMNCFMKTFDLNRALTLTTTKYIFQVRRSAPTLSNFRKGIRKTDIALLIDDSCNDCVLVSISSPHHFTLFRVTQFTIQRYYQVVIYQNHNLEFKL